MSAKVEEQRIWGPFHALVFAAVGVGSAAYSVTVFGGLADAPVRDTAGLLGLLLVVLGALSLLATEPTYRGVFLRHFLSGLQHSWMSRGVTSVILLVVCGALAYAADSQVLAIIAGLVGLAVTVYPAFVLASSSILFWRTGLLPLSFLVGNLAGGLSLIILVYSVDGSLGKVPEGLRTSLALLLLVSGVLALWHLAEVPAIVRKQSVELLLRGGLRPFFLGGTLLLGLLAPVLLVVLVRYVDGLPENPILPIVAVLVLQGLVMHAYYLLRAGLRVRPG